MKYKLSFTFVWRNKAHTERDHPRSSRRKDEKKVSVCRFISRKTKYDVLEVKKKEKIFKYEGNEIYINEHLSPMNRRIFGEASVKRKELQYKHLWTTVMVELRMLGRRMARPL